MSNLLLVGGIGLGTALAISLLGVLFVGRAAPDAKGRYTVASWAPVVEPLARAAGLEPAFVLRWFEVESGGNPCAFGAAGAKGPDGNPRELGLAQLYNPDDLVALDVDARQLRAYCAPGTQQCTRLLTATEERYAVETALRLIVRCRDRALHALDVAQARWSARDAYRLTKLVHALPGLVTHGLDAVTGKLGRAPRDWAEYKATLAVVRLDSGTERYRPRWPVLFANAEKTAAALPDPEAVS